MTVATVDRPVHATEMGRREAEEITKAIQNNFDSLGAMILQARDRKAYKALGYRSFDTYCQTEFGKSVSHAYQLIEDVKVIAELEAEISKQYDERVTLNFPSSHLRPLKELSTIGDKLKAIEYAQKIATAEGKKPTKKHLEIAVFQISGHRSADFKSAIEGLGFTKGVQVEVTKSLKKDRGFVTRTDKRGKIHVELYNGGAVTIPYDADDLRILEDSEKPAIPASDTANKGDKVKIFAKGWEGQIGEIFIWQMGKHAMVKIANEQVPVNIAYAELEIIKEEIITVKDTNRWKDSDWKFNGNNYYYFEKENKIISSSWPTGLSLEPYSQRFDSPSEFMKQWEERFKPDLIRALNGNSDTTSEGELRTENQRLREQLAEAELAIEAIVDMAHQQIQLLPEVKESAEFSVENAASIPSPAEAEESWLSVLESNSFTQIRIRLDEEPTETYRGWDIHEYNSSLVDISHPSKGIFSTDLPWPIVEPFEWLKNIINQVEDFCPGQLSLELNLEVTNPEVESFPQPLLIAISNQEKKLHTIIDKKEYLQQKGKLTKKEVDAISANNLQRLENSLQELRDFRELRIGQPVTKRFHPELKGRITRFEMSVGGMPLIWVVWLQSEGGELIAEHYPLKSIAVET